MVIGFENGISDLVVFETKIRSIRLPPKASADPGFQRLGTYVHKSPAIGVMASHGVEATVQLVPYELFRGGNQMLCLRG